jgi:hypothetical protein
LKDGEIERVIESEGLNNITAEKVRTINSYINSLNQKIQPIIDNNGFGRIIYGIDSRFIFHRIGNLETMRMIQLLESRIINSVKKAIEQVTNLNKTSLINIIESLILMSAYGCFVEIDVKDSLESVCHKLNKKYFPRQLPSNCFNPSTMMFRWSTFGIYVADSYAISRWMIVKKWADAKKTYLNKDRFIQVDGISRRYRMSSRLDEITYEDITDEPVQKWITYGGIPNTKPEKAFINSQVRQEKEYFDNPVEFKNINMDDTHIRQILNSIDLIAEGREMHHCAKSYIKVCQNNYAYIFRCDVSGRSTVEVRTDHGGILRVVQHRGVFNTEPSQENKIAVQSWIEQINQTRSHRTNVITE